MVTSSSGAGELSPRRATLEPEAAGVKQSSSTATLLCAPVVGANFHISCNDKPLSVQRIPLKQLMALHQENQIWLFSCSPYDDVLKYMPTIREQHKDWEDGLSETEADGSFLHEHWNSDLRLFSYDKIGSYNLLQLLLIRAESEILRLSADTQQSL